MSPLPAVCREIEPDLVAAATGEAEPGAAERVQHHVDRCTPCRGELQRYRALDAVVGGLRRAPVPAAELALARSGLESRLADLRRRLVAYGIFPSALGRILIARSEEGVSLVEYLGSDGRFEASRLSRAPGLEATEGGPEIEALYRELIEYLEGERTQLRWPLDLRFARGEFHKSVLQATAAIPYGAVTSYTGIAREIGRPTAVRAVAQALRSNPVPIVIPCHRVIGASGALVGYAGKKIGLKQELLAVEGIQTIKTRRDARIERETMYACTFHDREYCVPTCASLASVTTLARLTLFASRERAEAVGLAPCSTCRPDLHPISH